MSGLGVCVLILWLVLRNYRPWAPRARQIQFPWIAVGKVFSVTLASVALASALLLTGGGLFKFGAALLLMLFGMPTLFLKVIVLPLGLPRTAYYVALLCHPLGFKDNGRTVAALYCALALRRRASPSCLEWLQARLTRQSAPLGAGRVAAGLVAALSGKPALARSLMNSAEHLSVHYISPMERGVARDWLVVDAAQSGDWRRVIGLGKGGGAYFLRPYTLARIAERLLGEGPQASNWQLCLLWLFTPGRFALLPLLRRALASSSPQTTPNAPAFVENPGVTDFSAALGELSSVLQQYRTVTAARLAQAVWQIDRWLERNEVTEQLRARLQSLNGAPEAAAVLDEFRHSLIDLLVPIIETYPHLASQGDEVASLRDAVAEVRQKLYREIEVRCADYSSRADNKQTMSSIEEWDAWVTLRELCERLLILDDSAQESLFETTYYALSNFAAYQYNTVANGVLAHAMFSWLHVHSQNNVDAARLLKTNLGVTRRALG